VPINRFLLGSVSLAALGVTHSAAAQEFLGPPERDWSGPYIGGSIGGAFVDGDISADFAVPGSVGNLDEGGVIGGGQLGWNFQHEQFVFGLEGDFSFLDVDDDTTFLGKGPGLIETEFDWFATIRGRAGVATGQTLFFVTVGAAFADAELSVSAGGIGATVTEKETLVGVTVGGGIEHWFTEAISGKLEYLYADLGKIERNFLPGTPGAAEPEIHIIRAGVNYHFCMGVGC
jgi:outer membrane immunogenic protein